MNIEITYCSMWNYEPQAVSLTSKLLSTYKQQIQDLKLIPASGGCFEVVLNGELVYSKLQTDKFPDEQSMIETVGEHIKHERTLAAVKK